MNSKTLNKFLLSILLCLTLEQATGAFMVHAQPPYAEWGLMAMQETHQKYPNADIIDYLHVGRRTVSPSITEEKFKLWLKEGTREFGVFVTIQFETRTKRVRSIQFQETDR